MSQISVAQYSFSDASHVVLEVGEKPKEHFTILKDLLCSASPTFLRIVEDNPEANAVTIADSTPAVFRLFLEWLYFRRLPRSKAFVVNANRCHNCDGTCKHPVIDQAAIFNASQADDGMINGSQATSSRQADMIHLYIFAHKFDVQALRESIIDQEWYETYKQGDIYTYQDMALVFQELPPSSPLRRLVVDAFATFWTPEDHARCKLDVDLFGKLPQELLFRAFSLLAMKRDNSALLERLNMPCAYHEHDETQAARDACLAKHESLHKRKYEEMNRAQHVWEAISGVTRGF